MPAFKQPCITILLPTYNAEAFIRETIKSILVQTYTNWECLIIDDASTDQTVQIIKSFKDKRIKLIEKPENSGYTNSLNQGLQCAKGKYIARMDADDIALPERLGKQLAFMEEHPDIIACGTAYQILGTSQIVKFPKTHEAIRLRLLEQTCFAHPSVMLRTSKFTEHNLQYDVSKEPAEDYDLWIKLSRLGKLANLNEVLLYYRVHNAQVSNTRRVRQLASKIDSRILVLSDLYPQIKTVFGKLLTKVFTEEQLSYSETDQLCVLVETLLKANTQKKVFDNAGLKLYLKRMQQKQLKQVLLKPKRFTPRHAMYYWKYYFKGKVALGFKTALIISVKSLIGYRPKEIVL